MSDNANSQKPSNDSSEVLSWILIGISFFAFWPLGFVLLFKKLAGNGETQKKKQVPPLYAPNPEDRPQSAGAKQSATGKTVPNMGAAANKAKSGTQRAKPNGEQSENFAKRMMRTPEMNSGTAKWLKIAGIIVVTIGVLSTFGTLSDLDTVAAGMFPFWELLTNLMWIGAGGILYGNGQRITVRARRFQKYYAIVGMAESMPMDRIASAAGSSEEKAVKNIQSMIALGMFGEGAYLDMELGYFFRSSDAAAKMANPKTEDGAPEEADAGYSGVLRNIRRANDRIADPVLSAKISRLEEITGKIFKMIEANPKRKKQIGTFLNYYLPTTQKLLDSYAEFEETGVDGENLKDAKDKIEQTMDAIVSGFEHQLDLLYQADAMDVSSDIDVMQSMLKRDGASSDFTVSSAKNGTAKKPKEEQVQSPNLVMRSDGTMGAEDEIE